MFLRNEKLEAVLLLLLRSGHRRLGRNCCRLSRQIVTIAVAATAAERDTRKAVVNTGH